MTPDASWPNLPNYRAFSPEDHAAHTTPKGIPYESNAKKQAQQAMKFVSKPHLKMAIARMGKRRSIGRRKKP